MRLIQFTFTQTDDGHHPYAALINDILWAHIGRSVEHITVTPLPIRVNVTLFIHHDVHDPWQFAESLIEAVHTASPQLYIWDVKVMHHSGDD